MVKSIKYNLSSKRICDFMIQETPNKESPIIVDYYKNKHILPEDTNKILCHPYNKILILNKGSVTYATDSGITNVAEKSIIFMPANLLHNSFVQNQPYERYRIKFTHDFTDGIFSDGKILDFALKKPYIKQLEHKDFDEINLLVQSLYKVSAQENKTDIDVLNECMHLAMLIVKGYDAPSVQNTFHSGYIDNVLSYIKNNYNKPITIERLADLFYVSKSKLIYDFKNHCRMNILEYITMTRIAAAKEYLIKGWSVSATSDACGFSSPSYFIKVFSKITELTPLKFQMKYAII